MPGGVCLVLIGFVVFVHYRTVPGIRDCKIFSSTCRPRHIIGHQIVRVGHCCVGMLLIYDRRPRDDRDLCVFSFKIFSVVRWPSRMPVDVYTPKFHMSKPLICRFSPIPNSSQGRGVVPQPRPSRVRGVAVLGVVIPPGG